jgi:hypothetical protein
VEFKQERHMVKAAIDFFDNPLFKIRHAFVHRNDGLIDAFVRMNHGSDRANQSQHRESDPDNQRQNLRISQLIFSCR